MVSRPAVGLGVLIFNARGELLLGKRQNAHGAGTWGPPGGHVEFGETFEECGRREVLEETGLRLTELRFCAVTNDVFQQDHKHYVSIFMQANLPVGQEVKNEEPHKIEEWRFFPLTCLPDSLFLPLANLIQGQAYGPLIPLEAQ